MARSESELMEKESLIEKVEGRALSCYKAINRFSFACGINTFLLGVPGSSLFYGTYEGLRRVGVFDFPSLSGDDFVKATFVSLGLGLAGVAASFGLEKLNNIKLTKKLREVEGTEGQYEVITLFDYYSNSQDAVKYESSSGRKYIWWH